MKNLLRKEPFLLAKNRYLYALQSSNQGRVPAKVTDLDWLSRNNVKYINYLLTILLFYTENLKKIPNIIKLNA